MRNPSREAQGELGRVPFDQYGTLLHIVNMHLMPDGRSLIETVGVSRFRVVKYGQLDGYTIGKIERIDDITLSAEETAEARETASPSTEITVTTDDVFPPTPPSSQTTTSPLPRVSDLNSLSTHALYDINLAFVKKMRDKSAPWLHRNVFQAYGEIPADMALFPWWFASVLPLEEREKYKLLATTSVRERLKITTAWVLAVEGRTWYVFTS
jgi:Lon protease-like protein